MARPRPLAPERRARLSVPRRRRQEGLNLVSCRWNVANADLVVQMLLGVGVTCGFDLEGRVLDVEMI